ncbi:MAG: HAD family hydrolase [Notoacmeibacter sp.]|nr:HAD family hydrolase [Notoacmeibacter sp.]
MDTTITTIGLDADDTLWHNERFFRLTQERFASILEPYADAPELGSRLLEVERRNLRRYGYGIKGFTLSMIETAVEITGARVPGSAIRQILDAAHDMLDHPVEPLPHVSEALAQLSGKYRVVLITKGDLFDQERKFAASGLADHFDAVEIVADKTVRTYLDIFTRHGDGPERALMAGNSLKSDVVPALDAGCWGVHVPHEFTWELEHAPAPVSHRRFREIENLGQLPGLVERLASGR